MRKICEEFSDDVQDFEFQGSLEVNLEFMNIERLNWIFLFI